MNKKEIRDRVNARTRETGITGDIDNYIDATLMEIQNPAWCYADARRREHNYLWNFNRRKTTMETVASQEDYELPRDFDQPGIIRQIVSPTKLIQIPDEEFFRLNPYPTATGNPFFYRLWEEVGTAVDLTVADTISVISDNANDTSQTVVATGYRDGIKTIDVLTLNGVTLVPGAVTFDAGRPLYISKSADTDGVITITESSGATTLSTLGKYERGARFKIISFYPIPPAITIYMEYYTCLKELDDDAEEPMMPAKWHYIVTLGAIAKVREYQNSETAQAIAQRMYATAVRSMIEADATKYDYIDHLRSVAENRGRVGVVKLSDTTTSPNFGSGMGVTW